MTCVHSILAGFHFMVLPDPHGKNSASSGLLEPLPDKDGPPSTVTSPRYGTRAAGARQSLPPRIPECNVLSQHPYTTG